MATDESSNCLVVVIDTSPIWWGKRMLQDGQKALLSQSIDAIMVFCSCHLMMKQNNKLVIIAAHTHCSRVIYPRPPGADMDAYQEGPRGASDGKYELFADVQDTIRDQLTDLILHDSDEVYPSCMVAGAVSRALCYINKLTKKLPPAATMSARVLVIQGSEDNQLQYMDLINVISTAQKQACDITEGMYLKVPQMSALLQYLMWVFLPELEERKKLSLPNRVHVDYRAACFCHRNLIDIGYVCSVCLSVFCAFSPICSTCQTTFKLIAPQKMLKRKGKKS